MNNEVICNYPPTYTNYHKLLLMYIFSFRGIWPKYYHEVHGFIFVVDACSNEERMIETSNVFKEILSHQKVRGKPILMLCNKADMDEAKGKM